MPAFKWSLGIHQASLCFILQVGFVVSVSLKGRCPQGCVVMSTSTIKNFRSARLVQTVMASLLAFPVLSPVMLYVEL